MLWRGKTQCHVKYCGGEKAFFQQNLARILLTLFTVFKIRRAATRSVAACRWWYGERESTWPCHYRLCRDVYLVGIQWRWIKNLISCRVSCWISCWRFASQGLHQEAIGELLWHVWFWHCWRCFLLSKPNAFGWVNPKCSRHRADWTDLVFVRPTTILWEDFGKRLTGSSIQEIGICGKVGFLLEFLFWSLSACICIGTYVTVTTAMYCCRLIVDLQDKNISSSLWHD